MARSAVGRHTVTMQQGVIAMLDLTGLFAGINGLVSGIGALLAQVGGYLGGAF